MTIFQKQKWTKEFLDVQLLKEFVCSSSILREKDTLGILQVETKWHHNEHRIILGSEDQ